MIQCLCGDLRLGFCGQVVLSRMIYNGADNDAEGRKVVLSKLLLLLEFLLRRPLPPLLQVLEHD